MQAADDTTASYTGGGPYYGWMFRKACTVTHAYSGVTIADLYLCYPHRLEGLTDQCTRAGVRMQACSRASLAGRRAEATAAPACHPTASLRPIPLPANRCFVSKKPHGASLPARCRTRLSPQAAATTAKTGSLAVFGSASGDVFIAGTCNEQGDSCSGKRRLIAMSA